MAKRVCISLPDNWKCWENALADRSIGENQSEVFRKAIELYQKNKTLDFLFEDDTITPKLEKPIDEWKKFIKDKRKEDLTELYKKIRKISNIMESELLG